MDHLRSGSSSSYSLGGNAISSSLDNSSFSPTICSFVMTELFLGSYASKSKFSVTQSMLLERSDLLIGVSSSNSWAKIRLESKGLGEPGICKFSKISVPSNSLDRRGIWEKS